MKQFIKIDNQLFKLNNEYFKRISTESFAIYCYIIMKIGPNSFVDLSIKQIQQFLETKIDYDLTIKDKKDKTDKKINVKVKNLNDTRTVKKHLDNLVSQEFIVADKDIKIVNVGDFIIFSLNEELFKQEDEEKTSGFTPINVDLFKDEIKNIGCTGWTILCLLTNLFNPNFGQESCEGFANPSEEYISKVLDVGLTTTKKYLKILEKKKLIKIEEQPSIKVINKYGEETDQYLPNHYIVKNRLIGNKYYLDLNKDKKSA
ncbi:hypothetical protein [Desulfosporosinus sp. FKA]|uniref:hypothetical protein n=1 Tax=Desulfosporosinus sp. FKA TaxID=1969834 RepID=UPI000B49E8DA|nr:hypothetical protein [Desulfosporosinus sp. FKA]